MQASVNTFYAPGYRGRFHGRVIMKEKALEYLKKDFLLNIDVIECIRRGLCDILYAESDGVLIKANNSWAYMLSCDSAETALRITAGRDIRLLVLHQMDQKEAVCKALGLNAGDECWQGVYTKKEPIPEDDTDIRCLDRSYAQKVFEVYGHHELERIESMINRSMLYGAFIDGELAGFIGWHEEGAEGLLEVLPEYRRRGLALALEKRLFNIDLEHGNVPFGQLFLWNEASRKLQEKMGMEFADGHICWLWKEKE